MSALDRWFDLPARGTTPARELRGAVATFLTMAYILFVNPQILGHATGMSPEQQRSLLAATALAAGVCSILMGVVVLDGVVTFFLDLAGLREAVLNAIPRDLRLAIGAGIGVFIAFIGLVNARLVIVPASTLIGLQADPLAALPPVTAGKLSSPEALVALMGVVITAVLVARRVTGALVIGILATTFVGYFWGLTKFPHAWDRPRFDVLFKADVQAALGWRYAPLLFALIMVDFFDTLGTASAVAEQARLIDE